MTSLNFDIIEGSNHEYLSPLIAESVETKHSGAEPAEVPPLSSSRHMGNQQPIRNFQYIKNEISPTKPQNSVEETQCSTPGITHKGLKSVTAYFTTLGALTDDDNNSTTNSQNNDDGSVSVASSLSSNEDGLTYLS